MALISCPECAAEISDKALACPKCGHPSLGKVPAGGSSGRLDFLDSFFGVWTSPRQVVRRILDQRPGYGVWLIILVSSLLTALKPGAFMATSYYIGDLSAAALVFPAVFLLELVGFWAWCLFSHALGRWFGGTADFRGVTTANAWANPPYLLSQALDLVVLMPIWVTVLFFPDDLVARIGSNAAWQKVLGFGALILALWGMVLMVVNLSEAQRFSKAKAFLVLLLYVVPCVMLYLGLEHQFPEFFKNMNRWNLK
jgi:hypothetical protein